ncbi:MAG: tRNA (adenosine(37)-N6)-threonylcarbamoyltransferase complex dimerization subunit type 1 TsaB [Alkalilacustris sp.]
MAPERILAFDCAGPWVTAALLVGGRSTARHEDIATGQAERLFPLLQALLDGAALDWRDLGAIGVGIGPGNFTGLRATVAAARGLALGLGIPAIGVGLAEARRLRLPPGTAVVEPGPSGHVLLLRPDAPPIACPPEAAAEQLRGAPITGSAAARVAEAARDGAPGLSAPRILSPAMPLAEAIARIAATRAGKPQPRPAPLYLRPPDAAPPREAAPALLD